MSLREMGPQLKLTINVPNVGGHGGDIISAETSYPAGFSVRAVSHKIAPICCQVTVMIISPESRLTPIFRNYIIHE